MPSELVTTAGYEAGMRLTAGDGGLSVTVDHAAASLTPLKLLLVSLARRGQALD